jgi:hydroxymethylpyrimidine kinase/phosphomethylpyrimidine kinase
MYRVLTIAGSDSGGGAGIQADIKTITALGGYAMSVVTALTAQNTVGVSGVHEVPPDFIRAQFDAVMSDIGTDAAKTGMLASPAVVAAVAEKVRQYDITKLVVDPVIAAKSGDVLLSPDGKNALVDTLLPLAYVVTPNIPEAEIIAGMKIETSADMETAARKIAKLGPGGVIVKGGHLPDEPVDVLFDGADIIRFEKKRIETKNTHGTGCTFSAAIAAGLGAGMDLKRAVTQAEAYVQTAITFSLDIGHGHGPTDHTAWFVRERARWEVIESLTRAAALLVSRNICRLIPEVQSNLGFALPRACDHTHVAAFPGRIVRAGDRVIVPTPPAFGASRHVANVILTVMRSFPEMRSAMNIRFSEDLIQKAGKKGLTTGTFSRADEPDEVREAEGSSLAWGVDVALRGTTSPLDLIYDRGDVGKEPMIRVIGKDPLELVEKVFLLLD